MLAWIGAKLSQQMWPCCLRCLACIVSILVIRVQSAAPWPEVSTESEFLMQLASMEAEDIRSVPFAQVEMAVQRGWWVAARSTVVKSHDVRLDLTAPVRKAVAEVKREADTLMKWLDPSYAVPEATCMATRWTQNATHIVLTARFATKWEAPGANLAVFSTEKGQGHVDPARTAEAVKKETTVLINSSVVTAEIIAEAANTRKRYILEAKLFDEIVPGKSGWGVELRRAQGSMQMSAGAQIPELRFVLKKRWLDNLRWPQLARPTQCTMSDTKEQAEEQDSKKRRSSILECRDQERLYCPGLDLCMDVCSNCPHAEKRHSVFSLCSGQPFGLVLQGDGMHAVEIDTQNASFLDEDLREGFVGGVLAWNSTSSYFAEQFIALGSGQQQLAEEIASGDVLSELMVPHGTELGMVHPELQILAKSEVSTMVVARAEVVDRVKPPAVKTLKFNDTDARRDWINGTAGLHVPSDRRNVVGYEIHAATKSTDGTMNKIKQLQRIDVSHLSNESLPFTSLQLGPAEVPRHADWLVAYSFSHHGILSEPAVESLHDIGPPTLQPTSVSVSADKNRTRGFASFQVTVRQATCKDSDPRCDVGDHYLIYWGRAGAKFGASILRLDYSQKRKEVKGQVADALVPPNVDSVFVVALNQYGESRQDRHGGTSTPFRDIGIATDSDD
eukprot:2427449-Amphidinium_carterae.1